MAPQSALAETDLKAWTEQAVKITNNQATEHETSVLKKRGFTKWTWQQSDCPDCPIQFIIKNPELRTPKVESFVLALSSRKSEILEIYPEVSGEEYNLLAHMALGILGRESKFFQSRRYHIKESFPWAVELAKSIRSLWSDKANTSNSRGPTQIKKIPERLAEFYNMKTDELGAPDNAAIATMGFLIESLKELKQRIHNGRLAHEINASNYIDYLPYVYFGGTRQLIKGTAEPHRNLYVKEMKTHMAEFDLYQKSDSTRLGASPARLAHGQQ